MKRVWKYVGSEPLDTPVVIEMPAGPIVHAEMASLETSEAQHITVWVEVIDSAIATKIKRLFITVGTGQVLPGGWHHVLTQIDGRFVWHLYEGPVE